MVIRGGRERTMKLACFQVSHYDLRNFGVVLDGRRPIRRVNDGVCRDSTYRDPVPDALKKGNTPFR